MAVMLGLCAALGWGLTDFLAGASARRAGVGPMMLFSSLAGLAALTVRITSGSDHAIPRLLDAVGSAAMIWVLLAGVLSAAASLCLATGLSVGRSAIVAPIAMSYGAVATLLSLATGEAFGVVAVTGLLLCLVGAPLTALDRNHGVRRVNHADDRARVAVSSRGVVYALGAAFCYGVGFWIQGRYSVPRLGMAGALFVNYACGVLVGCVVSIRAKQSGVLLLVSPRFYIQAFASIVALACLAYGATLGSTAIVTVLSSLSGGMTALLACVFRNEPLAWTQMTGIVGATIGAALLAM